MSPSVQARTIDLTGGGAAKMVLLGNAPPMFMASDMLRMQSWVSVAATLQASRRLSSTAIKKRS
jgi:hypothetical protein